MINNIKKISWPYFWILKDRIKKIEEGEIVGKDVLLQSSNVFLKKKLVVVFGVDFKNISEINSEIFIKKINECLGYIKKNYAGYTLIYRPHPDEKDEKDFLDLSSFIVQKDEQIAEDFLLKNYENIKCVFSVCSTSSISAYNMGLNSYCFFRYFRDTFLGAYKIFVEIYFSKLPDNFFIENLDTPVTDNKIKLSEDLVFKEDFSRILIENTGPIWFIVVENRFLNAILGLTEMIKEYFPERKINLIISKHHRWAEKIINGLRQKFNSVLMFPRVFYSLRPAKLLSAFKISREVKKISIDNGSILIGFAHHDFIENCFISYNKNKYKISFIPEETWRLNFKAEELIPDSERFKFNKASLFFNKLLEPFLGLNKTIFMHYGKESHLYLIKTARPIENIYDRVYMMKNSPIG